jgi:uncharacterized membrane protein
MTIWHFIKLSLLGSVILGALDYLWLGIITKNFIQRQLGHLLRPDTQWFYAGLFYIMFGFAIMIFAVIPGLEKHSLWITIGLAGFLGLVAYGTYEFTNMATLSRWPKGLIIPDILWGVVASAITAKFLYFISRWV